jgi:RNA polymerase sigma-70 factor (ECF subfamily)
MAEPASESLDEHDVYAAHFDDVVRWARRLAGPAVDFEDVVQEVFMVALPRLPTFRGEAKLGTWLFRITQRIAQQHRRKLRRRRWLAALFGEHEQTCRTAAPPAADAYESERAAADLYEALDVLDDHLRSTFILFALEDLPAERIAELQEISASTVWVRVHRARKKLRKHLARTLDRSPGGAP